MLEFYWGCLIFGGLFALVTIVFGDLIGQFMDGSEIFQPMVLVGGITAFGGVGVLLMKYSAWTSWIVLTMSLVLAFLCSVLVYFFYVKPMQSAENSTGYSIYDLTGRVAEVSIPIPADGYGEVLIKVGAGNTHQIAASFDRESIQSGTRVVVVEVKDDTLYVSRFENT